MSLPLCLEEGWWLYRWGGLSVDFRVWVAEVQDPCILGLDFLRATRCVLDLGGNTLAFPGGPTVEMVHPTSAPRPHLSTIRASEEHGEADLSLQVTPPTPVPPIPHRPVDVQPSVGGLDRLAGVREVWKRSCDNLELRQQEELWQLLWV